MDSSAALVSRDSYKILQVHQFDTNSIMTPLNTLVFMDEDKLDFLRSLDIQCHNFTSRMHRWVLYGIALKSELLGAKWEKKQANYHAGENTDDWRYWHMPYAPTERTFWHLPTHCTSSLWSWEIYGREVMRGNARREAAAAKFEKGYKLTRAENDDYQEYLRLKEIAELPPPVIDEEQLLRGWYGSAGPPTDFKGFNAAPCDEVETSLDLPAGLGLHIRPVREYDEEFGFITASDACENIGGDVPYIMHPAFYNRNGVAQIPCLMIEAVPQPAIDEEQKLTAMYDGEVCVKDGSWLLHQNPYITEEMISKYHAELNYNKNEAGKTLDSLKLFGKNIDLLTPMVHAVMKDKALCQEIHKELLERDIGFLSHNDARPALFYSRVKAVFATLDRWAVHDIDCAIDDVRLILQDHELVTEMIDALNGKDVGGDRILRDPVVTGEICDQCSKDFEELAILYGREHSTLMPLGCTSCEGARIEKAKDLLWSWYEHPDLLSDDGYKRIFGVDKGFKLPEDDAEANCLEVEEEDEEDDDECGEYHQFHLESQEARDKALNIREAEEAQKALDEEAAEDAAAAQNDQGPWSDWPSGRSVSEWDGIAAAGAVHSEL